MHEQNDQGMDNDIFFNRQKKGFFSLVKKKKERKKKGFSISRKKCEKEIETLSWRIQRAFLSQKRP